jgi:hypothetical protein
MSLIDIDESKMGAAIYITRLAENHLSNNSIKKLSMKKGCV